MAVSTPLGDEALLLLRMFATERLSGLFEYTLDLLAPDHDVKFEDVLSENFTVRYELRQGEARYFNGFVSEFSHVGENGNYAAYRATLRPWLWFLTRTADCRIFQGLTIPEIVAQVFRDRGFTDFDERLTGEYEKADYCVQYRETDFNFVSRLLEDQGIYYYFIHEDGKHSLVLADSYSAHDAYPGYEEVVVRTSERPVQMEHVYHWSTRKAVQPGRYALKAFDFEKPNASLGVNVPITREHGMSDLEFFDYPGEYKDRGAGEADATIRIEELQAEHEVAEGAGNAGGIAVGYLMTLVDHPRSDQNKEYLISSANHELVSDDFETDVDREGMGHYTCEFTAIDSREPYRPPRMTPKSIIQGPQTAVVVGPSQDEIHTDSFGRVKVQFHWDRYGKLDENSSCWVRVAQVWAGKRWGGVYTPRIGQEVIVEFLEGDPDRPIITGRVYNGDNMPPYELPGSETISTLKSNSSKGGEGFNELRFEDKKGEEQVYIHAEKNFDLRVKNNRFENIGYDRHLVVEHDKREHVKNDRHETVDNHHVESVGGDLNVKVAGKEAKAVDGTLSLTVGGDAVEAFKGGHSVQVSSDYYVKATNVVIEAMSNVTLKVGQSFVAIEAGGIKIGTVGQLELQGTQTSVKGSAMVQVQGGIVKIN